MFDTPHRTTELDLLDNGGNVHQNKKSKNKTKQKGQKQNKTKQ